MSKRKKKSGKQFKLEWIDPHSRHTKKRKGGRHTHVFMIENPVDRIKPYKSPFFSNE